MLEVARAVAEALRPRWDASLVAVDADLHHVALRLRELRPACVFNLCESIAGDARLESALPMILEGLGIRYTGSPPAALALALHKDRVKKALRAAKVPTPAGGLYQIGMKVRWPAIVKPSREDGSSGICAASVVRSESALRGQVRRIEREFRQPALVEEYVDGLELNVSVLGHPPRALPPWAIDFSVMPAGSPKIVTYDGKWKPGSLADRGSKPVRASLDRATERAVVAVALAAFRAVGLRDYGRVDVRLAADGTPFVIDVNPNCDLSPSAGFARAAAAAGLSYAALVDRITSLGRRRRG